MATNITATQIRRQFAEIAKKVEAGESHLVTRHNKVIFAIISGADYDKFQTLLQMQESLEDFIKKSNIVPVKQLTVTLPPTMYKVEAVAEPVHTPLDSVTCEAHGEKGVCSGCTNAITNDVSVPETPKAVASVEEIKAEPYKGDCPTKGLFTGD